MKRFLIVVFALLFTFISNPVLAASCKGSKVCDISKSDFELKDIKEFKYLDWSYSSSANAYLMGPNGFHHATGTYNTLGYTIPNAQIVDYYASIMEFPSKKEAQKLVSTYLNDVEEEKYSKSAKYVFKKSDANGTMIFWVHKNLLIMLSTNKDSVKEKDFLSRAFKIYSKKFKPEKVQGNKF